MEYIIGVDIGTTSTKTLAYDFSGAVKFQMSSSYPTHNPKPNYYEQDPKIIFRAVMDTLREVVSNTGNVIAISFSSAMHSLILMDRNGKNLTNSIIWADTRSEKQAEQIRGSSSSHEIYRKTGTPIHPMSPLCKLVWLKENERQLFDSTYKFISIKEYVFWRLFGKYIIDHSIASATGLFDIYENRWHQEALVIAGINEEQLSKPVPVTHVEKGMNPECASFLGIKSQLPIVIGASDGCLANLGSNAIKTGEAAVTIGTSGAIRVTSDKPLYDDQERIFSYILADNFYVSGGPVNNGGNVLKWFIDNFLDDIKDSDKAYSKVNELANEIDPACDGLIFLPYLLGERAPFWDGQARGVFFGVSMIHTKGHFARSVMEGIVYSLYSIGMALEESLAKIRHIYAGGGFAQSKLWLQILADIFGKEVHVAPSIESSSFGAMVIGMKAMNLIQGIEDVNNLSKTGEVITPNINHHKIYLKHFDIFNGLYKKLKEDFSAISRLQK